jgi:DNA topoisomerase 2-associated protein PAT1
MNEKKSQKLDHLKNEECDEYANLMTKRDKQWLLSIQLTQLNISTPYIDDYYYTVFKERQLKLKGEQENTGRKYEMSQKDIENWKSEKNIERTPRTYTHFENSLGKIQCVNLTTPRQLIDMDVMGSESFFPLTTSVEMSTQRTSRQILMHIETLYLIVLELEDLDNSTAVSTLKKCKEKESIAGLEQPTQDHMTINKEIICTLSCISIKEKENKGRDVLLRKLVTGLASEMVAQMMTARKGKTLLRRIMPLIENSSHRWKVWYNIFATLPLLIKKDQDDTERFMLLMFPEFKNQMQHGSMMEIVDIADSLISFIRPSYMLKNKFYISCIIVLMLRAECIMVSSASTSKSIVSSWLTFLTILTNAAKKKAYSQMIGATIQSNNIKPLTSHLSRFHQLKSQQLLAVLTQDSIIKVFFST